MSYRKLIFLLVCIVSLSAAAQSTVHNYLVVEPKNPKALLKELNTPQLLELRPDKEYRFGVGLYGYKDDSGKSVIEPQFFAASDFGDGLAAVKRQEKDKWGYILPVDVDPRNTDVCYPLDKLYGQLGELGANSVTVLIDACFSGANHGDGMLLAQSMGVALRPKAVSPTGNMVVLSAAQGDETAYPFASQNHGLFTYWLLKKLKESRGDVSLGDLSDFVTENVRKTSVIENRKMQNPAVAVSPALTAVWRALPLVK